MSNRRITVGRNDIAVVINDEIMAFFFSLIIVYVPSESRGYNHCRLYTHTHTKYVYTHVQGRATRTR